MQTRRGNPASPFFATPLRIALEVTPVSFELPHRLGPFRLLRHIASGGMGDVYLAHQRLGPVDRLCVVKTVRPDFTSNAAMMQRFVDEARTMASLSHKNLAAVLDVGEADGVAYIAVEHIAGRDLRALLHAAKTQGRALPREVALVVFGELLDALSYVHRAFDPRTGKPLQVVHRDVSPHNVMVSFEGEVKLIDFGIARTTAREGLTQAGRAVGKIRYMSPEQARAEPVDSSADVFAACVCATEMLTGRRFYGAVPKGQLWFIVAHGPPEPKGFSRLPKALQELLAAGLAPRREDRPSAQALKDRLLTVQLQLGAVATSGVVRDELLRLLPNVQDDDRVARARVLQEPTAHNAAALFAGGPSTGSRDGATEALYDEDTPAALDEDDDVHAAPDDVTASVRVPLRGSEALTTEQRPRLRRPRGLDGGAARDDDRDEDSASTHGGGDAGAQPSGAVPRSLWALAAAVTTAAVVVVVAVLWVALRPAVADADDDAGDAAPVVDIVDIAPLPVPDAGVFNAGAVALDAGAVAPDAGAMAPDADTVDAGAPLKETKPDRKPDKPERPTRPERPRSVERKPVPALFGDRVRALSQCTPEPGCAPGVLARVERVRTLPVDELRELDADLTRCLLRCW